MQLGETPKSSQTAAMAGIGLAAFLFFKLLIDPALGSTLLSLILGINVNQTTSQSAKSLAYLKPEMIRLDGFPWDIIEARKGVYNFAGSDKLMKWVRSNDLKVLGILQYAPAWANGQDFKTPPTLGMSNCGIPDLENTHTTFNALRTYPPNNETDFGNYAYTVAKRYKDVVYWQIWNEPNNPIFWPSGPDAHQYTQMLKSTYGKIKKANPRAQVVLGGISLNDLEYINKLYAAGAKNYFDILAVHLYNPAQAPHAYLENELEKLHMTMAENYDSTKAVWLTEIGWHTGTADHSVSEQEQADYLEETFSIAQTKSYIGAVFWNTLMDCGMAYDTANPEHNFGVSKSNLQPKQAADVMRGIMLKKQK
jgi:hypothetical protein